MLDEKCSRSRCSTLAKISLSERLGKVAFSAWPKVLQNLSNALDRGDFGSPPDTVAYFTLDLECATSGAFVAGMIQTIRKRWQGAYELSQQ